MANLVQISAFVPGDLANITNVEWNTFVNAANFADRQINMGLAILPVPIANVHPAMPQAFLNNPANATTTHLNGLFIQLLITCHTAALAIAQAQQPQQGGQQQQPPPPPLATPPQIKATTPTKYSGKTQHTCTFIAECNNYFMLVPMNDQQQICFALQLIDKDGAGWKRNQLGLISQIQPLAHLATWAAFTAEFNLCFVDPKEWKKATTLLNHRKVVQTTSVQMFINLVQEKCDLAHCDDVDMCMDIIEASLKLDLAQAVARRTFAGYPDFVHTLIATNKALQWLQVKEGKKTFGSGSSASGSGSSKMENKDKLHINNSKYKLTEEEKKEHMDSHLCFKCHKPSHGSKDCKNPQTVYSKVQKVVEVKTKEEVIEEDFSDCD